MISARRRMAVIAPPMFTALIVVLGTIANQQARHADCGGRSQVSDHTYRARQ